MRRIRNRVLSALLALSMVLTMLPVSVFAITITGFGAVDDGNTPLSWLHVKMQGGQAPTVEVVANGNHDPGVGKTLRMGYMITANIDSYGNSSGTGTAASSLTSIQNNTGNLFALDTEAYWPAAGGQVSAYSAANGTGNYVFPMMMGYAEVGHGYDTNTSANKEALTHTHWNSAYAATWQAGNHIRAGNYSGRYQKQSSGTVTNTWAFNATEFPNGLPYTIFIWNEEAYDKNSKTKIAMYEFYVDFYGNAEFTIPVEAGIQVENPPLSFTHGDTFALKTGTDATVVNYSEDGGTTNEDVTTSTTWYYGPTGKSNSTGDVSALTGTLTLGSDTMNDGGTYDGLYLYAVYTRDGTTYVKEAGQIEVTSPNVFTPEITITVDSTAQADKAAVFQPVLLHPTDGTKNETLVWDNTNGYYTTSAPIDGAVTWKVQVNEVAVPASGSAGSHPVDTGLTVKPDDDSTTGDYEHKATIEFSTVNFKSPAYVAAGGSATPSSNSSHTVTAEVTDSGSNTYTALDDTGNQTVVLKGKTDVTFTINGTAPTDHKYDWKVGNPSSVSYEGSNSATYTINDLASNDLVTGYFVQNVYTVTGVIDASATGTSASDVKTVTLTDGTNTYTGTISGTTVTVSNVPVGTYTVTTTASAGKTVTSSPASVTISAGHTSSTGSPAFTLTISTTSHELTVSDSFETTYNDTKVSGTNLTTSDTAPVTGDTVTGSGTNGTLGSTVTGTRRIERVYDPSSTGETVVVTVKNTGNVDLTDVKVDTSTLAAFVDGSVAVSDDAFSNGTGITLAPTASATFTIQMKNNLGVTQTTGSDDEVTFPITAVYNGQTITFNYVLDMEVTRRPITQANVTTTSLQPVADQDLAAATDVPYNEMTWTDATLASPPATLTGDFTTDAYKVAAFEWTLNGTSTVSETVAAHGKVYTLKVVLEPNANYAFDNGTYGNAYTIENLSATAKKMSGSNLELYFTYRGTAPEITDLTLAATAATTADAELTGVDTFNTSDTKVYYQAVSATGTAPTTENEVITNPNTNPSAVGTYSTNNGKQAISGLTSYTDYTLYAVARVEATNTYYQQTNNAADLLGEPSEIGVTTGTTWHQVDVKVAPASGSGASANAQAISSRTTPPNAVYMGLAYNAANDPATVTSNMAATPVTQSVSVKDGSVLDVTANRTNTGTSSLGNPTGDGWAFQKWSVTDGSLDATINDDTASPNKFAPDTGVAAGTASTVTALYRRVIEGDPTVTDSDGGTVDVGDTLTAVLTGTMIGSATPTTSTTGVSYQWQYNDGSNWVDIPTADGGDAGSTWTVIAGTGNVYVGKPIRVVVTYDDNDGDPSSVHSDGTGTVGKQVSNPTTLNLYQAENSDANADRTNPISTYEDDGGLRLVFLGDTTDDAVTGTSNITNYEINVYTVSGTLVRTVTIDAATHNTGGTPVTASGYTVEYGTSGSANQYTVWLPADYNSGLVPTEAAGGNFYATVRALVNTTGSAYTSNSSAAETEKTTGTESGLVTLTKDMLTYGGANFSSDGTAFDFIAPSYPGFADSTFNGSVQTITGVKTPASGARNANVKADLTLYYFENSTIATAGYTTTGQTNVNITSGVPGPYYVAAEMPTATSGTGGQNNYYLPLAKGNACLGPWEIVQADPTVYANNKSTGVLANTNVHIPTDGTIGLKVEYTTGTSPALNNPITSYYDFTYSVSPNTASVDAAGNFRANSSGIYTVTVTADYSDAADDQFRANLDIGTKRFTITVSENNIQKLTLVTNYTSNDGNNTAVDLSSLLTQTYNGSGSITRDLEDLMVVATYTNGQEYFTLGGTHGYPALPSTIQILAVTTNGTDNVWDASSKTVSFAMAGNVELQARTTSGGSTITSSGYTVTGTPGTGLTGNAKVNVVLNPAVLNYTVTGVDKSYDGTTAANYAMADENGWYNSFATNPPDATTEKNSGKDSTVAVTSIAGDGSATLPDDTHTSYQATAGTNDQVYIDPATARLKFDDKNAGAGRTVSADFVELTGAQAGYYKLGTETTDTATIERAKLYVVDIYDYDNIGGTDAVTGGTIARADADDILRYTTTPVDEDARAVNTGTSSIQFKVKEDLTDGTKDDSFVYDGDTVTLNFTTTYPDGSSATAADPVEVKVKTDAAFTLDAASRLNYDLDTSGLLATLNSENAATGDGDGDGHRNIGTVTDRTVKSIGITGGTTTVTYGVTNGTYAPTDATTAKSMTLNGLQVAITWSDNMVTSYTVGTDALPSSMTFTSGNSGVTVGTATPTVGGANAVTFTKADSAVITVSYGTTSSGATATGTVTYTMNPKPLTYTITGANKTYDGTVQAQNVERVTGTVNTAANNSTISLTTMTGTDTFNDNKKVLDGDDVTVSATLTFADKNMGTNKAVSASSVTLGNADGTGGEEGFYTVSGNPGSANITQVKLYITDVYNRDNLPNPANGASIAYATPIDQYDVTDKTVSGKATNVGGTSAQFIVGTAADDPVKYPNGGVIYTGDTIILDFDVIYHDSSIAGDVDVTVDVSTIVPSGTGVGNYEVIWDFDKDGAMDDRTKTDVVRDIGTVNALNAEGFTIIRDPATDTYTYPDTSLDLTDMIVQINWGGGVVDTYTYNTPDYNALNLEYYYKDSNGDPQTIDPGDEIPVYVTEIYVTMPGKSGDIADSAKEEKTYDTFAVTINPHVLVPGDYTQVMLYAAKTYDGTTEIRAAAEGAAADTGLFQSDKITRVTVISGTDVAANLAGKTHTDYAATYVDADNDGKLDYVLLPIKAIVYGDGTAKENAAWLKFTLAYDHKDVNRDATTNNVESTHVITMTLDDTTPIVGDNAARYTLGTDPATQVDANHAYEAGTDSVIRPRPITVEKLSIAEVSYAAASATKTGTAGYDTASNGKDQYTPAALTDFTGLLTADMDTGDVTVNYQMTYGDTKPAGITSNTQFSDDWNGNALGDYIYKNGNGGASITPVTAAGLTFGMALSGTEAGNYTLANTAVPATLWGALERNLIDSVTITPSGAVSVAVGMPLNQIAPSKQNVPLGYEATAQGDAYTQLTSNQTGHFQAGTGILNDPEGDYYTIENVLWKDVHSNNYYAFGSTPTGDNGWHETDDNLVTFGYKETYTINLNLADQLGYAFTEDTEVYLQDSTGTYTVGTAAAPVGPSGAVTVSGTTNANDETTLVLSYTFEETEGPETIIAAVVYVKTPAVGETIADYDNANSGTPIYYDWREKSQFDIVPGTFQWVEGNHVTSWTATGSLPALTSTTFKMNTIPYYTAVFTVDAKDGYDFIPDISQFYFMDEDGFVSKLDPGDALPTTTAVYWAMQPGPATSTGGISQYEVRAVYIPTATPIEMVEVDVAAPTVGATPDATTAVTATTPTDAVVSPSSATWWDGTTQITAPATFAENSDYTVKLTLTATSGHQFTKDSVIHIDGMVATIAEANTAWNGAKEPYKTIYDNDTVNVVCTFTATGGTNVKHDLISVVVDAPVGGNTPDGTATAVSSGFTIVDQSGGSNVTATWYEGAAASGTALASTDKFKYGTQYTVKIDVTLRNHTLEWDVANLDYYINSYDLTNDSKGNASGTAPNYTLTYTFTTPAQNEITSVDLLVDKPVVNGGIDSHATIEDVVSDSVADGYATTTNLKDTTLTWVGSTVGSVTAGTDTFVASETYTMTATLTANDGYVFTEGKTSFMVNGSIVDVTVDVSDAAGSTAATSGPTAKVTWTVTLADPTEITSVNVDMTDPVARNSPDQYGNINKDVPTGSVADGYNDTTASPDVTRDVELTWTDKSTSTALASTDKFEANKTYQVKFELEPKSGYQFADGLVVTINGKWNGTVDLTTTPGKAIVTYDFPVPQDTAVILVDLDVAIPAGGNTIDEVAGITDTASGSVKDGHSSGATDNTKDTDLTWTTGGSPVASGSKYAYGTTYIMTTTLEANTGYVFVNGTTTALVNGSKVNVTLTALEASGATATDGVGPKAKVTWEVKIPAATILDITHVDVDLKEPARDGVPTSADYNKSTDVDATPDNSVAEEATQTGLTWYLKGNSTALTASDPFQAGQTYTVKFTLNPATGYKFTDNPVVTINNELKGTVAVDGTTGVATVTCDFEVPEKEIIFSVDLELTPDPGAGDPIDGYALITDAATGSVQDMAHDDPTDTSDNNKDVKLEWKDGSSNTVTAGTAYVNGTTYTMTAQLEAVDGYLFSKTSTTFLVESSKDNVGYKIYASAADVLTNTESPTGIGTVAVVTWTVEIPDKDIQNIIWVDLKNVDVPAVGGTPDLVANPLVADPDSAVLDGNPDTASGNKDQKVSWEVEDGSGGYTNFTGSFEAGKTYKMTAVVAANTTTVYRFATTTVAKVNGSTVDVELTRGPNGETATITWVYEVEREPVLSVDVTLTEPVKGAAPSGASTNVVAKPANSVAEDTANTMPLTWTDTAATGTVTAFEPGKTYEVEFKLTPESDYAFTTDSVVTINETWVGTVTIDPSTGVATVTCEFTVPAETIFSVNLDVADDRDNGDPIPTTAEIDDMAQKSVDGSKYDTNAGASLTWTTGTPPVSAGSTYAYDTTYKFTTTLTAVDGYLFSKTNTTFLVEGSKNNVGYKIYANTADIAAGTESTTDTGTVAVVTWEVTIPAEGTVNIISVDLQDTELTPVIGGNPVFRSDLMVDAPVDSVLDGDNTTTSTKDVEVEWFIKGTGNSLTAMGTGDTFQVGQTYVMTATVAANITDHYYFVDTTVGMVNGSNDSVELDPIDDGKKATITWTVDLSPKDVLNVDVAFTEPDKGDAPDDYGDITDTPTGSVLEIDNDPADTGNAFKNTKLTWTEKTPTGNYVAPTSPTFEAGKTYQVKFELDANTAQGYQFTNDTVVTINDKWVGKIETPITAGKITVTYEFTVPADENIFWVDLAVDIPAANNAPDGYGEITDSPTDSVQDTAIDPADSGSTKDTGLEWKEKTGSNTYIPVTGNFEAGKTYQMTATLTAEDGYLFSDNTTFLVNNSTTQVTATVAADGMSAEVTWEYTIPATGATYITKVDLQDVAVPVAGANPDLRSDTMDVTPTNSVQDDASVPGALDTAVEWYVKNVDTGALTPMNSADTFQAGGTYVMTATVYAKPGGTFYFDPTGDTPLVGLVNTSGVGVEVDVDTTTSATITWTYTIQTQDILRVNVNLVEPQVGDTPDDYGDITSEDPANSVEESANDPDTSNSYENTKLTWVAGNLDGNTFKVKETYTVQFKLKPAEGYQFSQTGTTVTVNTTRTGTITGIDDDGWAIVECDFTTPELRTDILTYVDAPVGGVALGNIATANPGVTVVGDPEWKNVNTGSTTDTIAAYGTVYEVTVTVALDDKNKWDTDNLNGFVNGNGVGAPVGPDANGNYTLTYQFGTTEPDPEPKLKDVAVVVTPPVAGAALDKDATANTGVKVIGAPVWKNLTTNKTGDTTAAYETAYEVTVTVQLEDPTKWDTDNLNGFVNGNGVGKPVGPDANGYYTLSYIFPKTAKRETVTVGGGGGGGGGTVTVTPPLVQYHLGVNGVTNDETSEQVSKNKYPTKVPTVTGVNDYTFIGWSQSDPATTEGDVTLVDPTKVKITEDTIFYAVYGEPEPPEEEPDGPEGGGAKPGDTVGDHVVKGHIAYVKGYPDNTFGPSDNITRAEVATIIARACLDGFVEGAAYGTGGYNDVSGHWAQSAIAYCTMHNVFKGYEDGTFKPNQAINRQEFALVFARLVGLQAYSSVPFSDIGYAADWALDGIYTAYSEGWVNGYTDGTFRPLNNITRAEAVKIVNRYLNRGVDEWGLTNAPPRTWPDVPETYWAYYEIIEAANGHAYYYRDNEVPPENWTALWDPLT